jgi:acetylornithine/N-succinyldiaminopimelate aminotransferase
MSALMPIYPKRQSVSFARGQGVWLTDQLGQTYLDALSGIGVCSLGHCHPAIVETIHNQSEKLLHTSNIYTIEAQEKLAQQLVNISGMEQVFFGNSGAEAIEAAIKITRCYARKKNIKNPIVIAMENSFHGRTMGAISASGSNRLRIGFEPLLQEFIHTPINDLSRLEKIISENKNDIVAILLEPIQGDGGIYPVTREFITRVRERCDQHDYLMIVDEIQTGLGRTGRWFAYQHFDLLPDVVTVAKALGNGIPISAYLTRGKANDLLNGKHGSTFAGNPFACEVALSVLATYHSQKILNNVQQMGEYLKTQLEKTLQHHPNVVSIRSLGLMLGIELTQDCLEIVKTGLSQYILFNVTANRVIRLLPPLILNTQEADEICTRLRKTIDHFFNR